MHDEARSAEPEGKMLYRVTEVSAQLSISRSQMYELLRSGALKSVRIGRSRRVRDTDLRAYVDSLSVTAYSEVNRWWQVSDEDDEA